MGMLLLAATCEEIHWHGKTNDNGNKYIDKIDHDWAREKTTFNRANLPLEDYYQEIVPVIETLQLDSFKEFVNQNYSAKRANENYGKDSESTHNSLITIIDENNSNDMIENRADVGSIENAEQNRNIIPLLRPIAPNIKMGQGGATSQYCKVFSNIVQKSVINDH